MSSNPAFTMNVWCTPEVICPAHRADEIAQLSRNSRPANRFACARSFVLGLKNEAMIWRISRRSSIIKWQGYRVSASRPAESNFRYTQGAERLSRVHIHRETPDDNGHRDRFSRPANKAALNRAKVAAEEVDDVILGQSRIWTLGRVLPRHGP